MGWGWIQGLQDMKQQQMRRQQQQQQQERENQIPGAPQSTPVQYQRSAYKPMFQQPQAYQQFQYKTPGEMAPHYANIQSGVTTAAKGGIRSGLEDVGRTFGARGLGRTSGLTQMGANRVIGMGSRNLAEQSRQIGFQRAQEEAGLEQWRQQQQAGEGQLGAQMARGDYQLENQLQNLDRQMDFEEWQSGRAIDAREREMRRADIMGQFQLDQALRQEQWQRQQAHMQYLMQLLGMQSGQQYQEGPTPGLLPMAGSLMQGGATIGGMFCLPKGTQIETENGDVNVEDVKVDDVVKGGLVVAISQRKRPKGHAFYNHKFVGGREVVMSDGHPFMDGLIDKTRVEHDSSCTYDILTEGRYYYVNGVKLGSTIK